MTSLGLDSATNNARVELLCNENKEFTLDGNIISVDKVHETWMGDHLGRKTGCCWHIIMLFSDSTQTPHLNLRITDAIHLYLDKEL